MSLWEGRESCVVHEVPESPQLLLKKCIKILNCPPTLPRWPELTVRPKLTSSPKLLAYQFKICEEWYEDSSDSNLSNAASEVVVVRAGSVDIQSGNWSCGIGKCRIGESGNRNGWIAETCWSELVLFRKKWKFWLVYFKNYGKRQSFL